ncbi:hypothetical protein NS183_18460 [Microbacterium testaceum]|nr:hypothetical protein NS183_18460 [Microbacterium testaceum]
MDVRGDIAPSHAFIDEAQVAEISVRRIWHTALSLTRAATSTGSPRDTLLVQVAGEARLSLGDDAAVALGPHAVVFLPGGQAFSLVSDEPTARIEIDYRAHDRAAAWVHGAGELVSASMILSAVNALFHTPVSGGGGGQPAAPPRSGQPPGGRSPRRGLRRGARGTAAWSRRRSIRAAGSCARRRGR